MSENQLDARITTPLVALGFVLAGLGLCAVAGAQMGWAIAVGLIVWAMLIGSPRVLLGLYWGWVLIYPLGSFMFPISILKWVDEIILLSLLAVLLLHQIQHFQSTPGLRGFGRSVGLLCALIAVSAVLNQAPKVGVAHFCLQYMRSFLLFSYTLRFFETKDSRLIFAILVLSFMLQVVLNTGWMLGINPLPNRARASADFAVGSFDACNLVAYLAIAVFCLAVAFHHLAPRRAQRGWALLLGIVALYQIHITFTLHAYGLLVICVLTQIATGGMLLRRRIQSAVGLALGLGLAGGLIYLASSGSELTRNELDVRYLGDRFAMMVEGPKGRAYKEVVLYAPRDMPYPLLGAGPGNFGSMVGRMNRRPLAEQYINYLLTAVDVVTETQGFSITSGPNTGFIALWSELGPFGFLLYWGLHVYAMLRVIRMNRRHAYANPYLQALAEAFVPTMVLWLTLSAIVDYNYIPYMHGGLWIWAAAVWRSDRPAAVPEAAALPPLRRQAGHRPPVRRLAGI